MGIDNFKSFESLNKLSIKKLKKEYDKQGQNLGSIGVSFILQEIRSRQDAKKTNIMLGITIVITILTAINVFLVYLTLGK